MIGRTVGRYRIMSKLGEGGMGSVWRAEDPLLGRQLALKFLPEALAESPEARRRFLREAQAASTLNHPGVATVFDAGESDGLVFIAMLLVEGETLSERVAGQPLPVEVSLRVAADAASALGHAHSHKVIHRDVSARNIMVGSNGKAVVVDFGLALPLEHTRLTQTGATMGTAAYMAPEVIRGGAADVRSDLYGLGVVLYEMLTGRLPFVAERMEAVLYAAVHRVPEPPSALRPGVPTNVDRVVMKLLEKEPARRYQHAADLEADLEAMLRGEEPQFLWDTGSNAVTLPIPVVAPAAPTGSEAVSGPSAGVVTPGAPPQSRRRVTLPPVFALRRRWVVTLGGLLFASLALVLVFHRISQRPAKDGDTRLAVLPLQNLSAKPDETAYLILGIGSDLATRLSKVSSLSVIPWTTSRRYGDLSRSPEEIAKELRVQVLVTGTFESAADRVRVNLSLVDPRSGLQKWAEQYEGRVAEIMAMEGRMALGAATQLKGELVAVEREALQRTPAKSDEAYDAYARGQEEMGTGGGAAVSRALEHFQHAVELDPEFAEAHVGIGAAQSDNFYYGWGGGNSLDLAEAAFKRALELDPALHAARGGLARVYLQQGKCEASLQLIADARRYPTGADQLLAIGEAYVTGGFPDLAIPVFEQVLELDPRSAGARWFSALASFRLGQWDRAIEEGNKFFADFGPDPDLLGYVGRAHHCLGDLEDAKLFIDQAVRNFRDEDSNAFVFLYASELHGEMGEAEEAVRLLKRGLALVESRLQAYPDNYRMRMLHTDFVGALGERDRATAEEQSLLREFPQLAALPSLLASMRLKMKDYDRAFELYRMGMQLGDLDPNEFHMAACEVSHPAFQQVLQAYEEARKPLLEKYAPAVRPPS